MVRCADCGLLAFRNKRTWELEEVPQDYRITALDKVVSSERNSSVTFRLHEQPICFSRAFNLNSEYDDKANILEQVKAVVERQRNCQCFVDWKQGFTPKEHQEMLDRQWEKQNARKWHIIELIIIVVGAGLFTLLGAYIARTP